jgi:glycosyltransferase involved in cell wall biosynthesis
MHILFLTDNFPPEVNAPASRTFEHCREWVAAGHQVTVVTCAPNFPKGAVFDGYKNRLWQSEIVEGVRVIRVWSYIARNEGFGRRVLDYISYMLTGAVAGLFVRKVDVVVGTSPQFFTAVAAYCVGSLKRTPWVFELRDLWPESIRAVGAMNHSPALDLLERLELFLYRRSSAVISVTHSFKTNLVHRGVSPDKIHVVTNGVDASRFAPASKDKALVAQLGLEGKFVAGYIGTHGMAHALETVLDAARAFKNAEDGVNVRFLMLGDGAVRRALQDKAIAEGLDNVIFLETVPKQDVPRYWSLLDASIIHLRKSELFTTVIPSKLFECMGMGVPVLHGVDGESADIVREADIGIAFEPENAQALVSAIRRLQGDPNLAARLRANGPRAALGYDRKALALRMLDVLTKLAVGTEQRPLEAKPAAANAAAALIVNEANAQPTKPAARSRAA